MSNPITPPPKEFATERLIVRSARSGDGIELHKAIGASLNEFYPWLSFSAELSSLKVMEEVSVLGQNKFHEGEFYVWRVWEPNVGMIGSVDLHQLNHKVPSCEIGYWVRSDQTGRGYAQEFVTAAIEIAQTTLKVERIEARCDVRNEPSWRLAEKLGFTFEGIARNDSRDAAGKLCSTKVYSLLRNAPE